MARSKQCKRKQAKSEFLPLNKVLRDNGIDEANIASIRRIREDLAKEIKIIRMALRGKDVRDIKLVTSGMKRFFSGAIHWAPKENACGGCGKNKISDKCELKQCGNCCKGCSVHETLVVAVVEEKQV